MNSPRERRECENGGGFQFLKSNNVHNQNTVKSLYFKHKKCLTMRISWFTTWWFWSKWSLHDVSLNFGVFFNFLNSLKLYGGPPSVTNSSKFPNVLRYIMQRPFRPKSPRGEPRDSHGQTLFMCKIKGFYCILVMHIVIFKIETPPPFSHSRGLVVK